MSEKIPQSVAVRVPLQAYLAGTNAPATGKTIAITISKNGGAYANPSAGATNATEIGSGSYYVDLSTTDAGTKGPLLVLGTEGTIDNVNARYSVADAHNAGFDGVPSATAGASTGLLISGSNSGTTTLGALTVTGATTLTGNLACAAGVTITQSTLNGHGVTVTGNGAGNGILATGGPDGYGSLFKGGTSSGSGLGILAGAGSGTDALEIQGDGAGYGVIIVPGVTGIGFGVQGGATSGDAVKLTTTSGHCLTATASGTAKHAFNLTGAAASGANAGGNAINAVGGAASSTGGGTAGVGMRGLGGAGAASNNGAAAGATFTGGGTTTVSGGDGATFTATGNKNGVTFAHSGSGQDLNATITPLTLVKATNITGFNDIAASAIVSSGAITTSGGAVSTVTTTTTATNLTNAPTAGDLTATMKTSIGTAVAASAVASVTAGVTVTTNNDKTGYSLTQSFPSNFASLGIGAGGHVLNVDTLTTYTGNTVQTGDSFTRIGATGSGLTSLAPSATALSTATWASSLATDIATSNTSIATILSRVTGAVALHSDAVSLSTQIGSPMQTGAQVVVSSAGLDNVLVAGKTLPAALKYIGAAVAGKCSGAGSGTETYDDFSGATAFVVTIDGSGNRTGFTYS